MRFVPGPPKVLAMCEYQGRCIVATDNGVYEVRGDQVVKLQFVDA